VRKENLGAKNAKESKFEFRNSTKSKSSESAKFQTGSFRIFRFLGLATLDLFGLVLRISDFDCREVIHGTTHE